MEGYFEKKNPQACVLVRSEIIIEADASVEAIILKC